MPAFNGERYVASAVQSVLKQRDVDLELIAVNDGSTDHTLAILQDLAQADARLRVITRPNSGRPAFPKNDGIAAARGDYVCFLDQDDLYDADRSRQLLNGLQQHPQWVAAFHDLRLIDREGDCLPDTYLSSFNFMERAAAYLTRLNDDWFECSDTFFVYQCLQTSAVHTQSVMIAVKRLPESAVVYDTQFTHCDDGDLWMRLHLLGKLGYLNRVLSSYRQHEDSLTRNHESFLMDKLKMWKKNLQRVGRRLSPDQLAELHAKLSAGFSDLGYIRLQAGRRPDARAAYRESLAWSPGPQTMVNYAKTFIPLKVQRHLKRTLLNHQPVALGLSQVKGRDARH